METGDCGNSSRQREALVLSPAYDGEQFCANQRYNTLLGLIGRHAIAAASIQMLKGKPDPHSLIQAIEIEKRKRDTLIAWRPTSMLDAQTKLIYLVHFLATTKRSFDHDEMSAIMGSIAHLL